MEKMCVLAAMLAVFGGVGSKPVTPSASTFFPFPFYSRDQWRGLPARGITPLELPVSKVIIHHSYGPGACFSFAECSVAMRHMQAFHQDTRGWNDIGYNFAVGSDGGVYEGRGWNVVGAHASSVNRYSLGIVLIGNWIDNTPTPQQLQAAQDLIAIGVKFGFIRPSYKLLGHRDVGDTECPGQALYDIIMTWPGSEGTEK